MGSNLSTLLSGNDVKWAAVYSAPLILALAMRYVSVLRQTQKGKLPPGPPGVPVFGNAFQLSRNAWTIFEDWKSQYGPLIYLQIVGQPFVVLNSNKVASDLLTRRASKYSDRHRSIVAADTLAGGIHIAFARYGDGWRRLRKAAHQALQKEIQHTFSSVQTLEGVILASSLLHDPDSWDNHLQRTTASLIMAVTYNLPPLESEVDPSIAHIRAHMDRLAYALYPGNFLVEFFPWMDYFPAWMAKWKRDAQNWFRRDSETFVNLYNDTQERMIKNDNPSFVASLEAQKEQHGLSQLEKAWLAASMYGAGAETSFSSLQWFMVAMVLHPEVQKKAHLELDAVVGRSRIPEFADFDHLPYIRAVVKEVLRWRPPIPLGLPHRLTEDDWYEGYYIPKGTLCLANIWGISRDEDLYGPDAREFNPSRHLDDTGNILPALYDTQDESHASFGFGRRICVGRHVANSTLFIDLACMLWSSSIEPFTDEQGQVQLPDPEKNTNTGLTLHPEPFKCSIKPRFAEAPAILNQTKEFYLHANGF
ncbi:cytochrome P450 [Leucogyrophana mollusca]|uniref:Cytochrome P450 n=1 Tax=Leucogyrophana mollusca TaxID=85980 RepID=A0ACB8BVB0_9AGAM|nr:cytochrome P450 [Leucogyrophana mollusca]